MNIAIAEPSVLIVNSGKSTTASLDKHVAAAFGPKCEPTIYSRPSYDDHPRMRPHKNPQFEVVLVDLTSWIQGADPILFLKQEMFPKWVGDDVLDALPDSLVVFLTPVALLNVINEVGKRLQWV